MFGLFKKKVFENTDFYDLAFLFEANGYTEIEANNICDFIDSKGRAPLVVRKTIGRICNRKEMTFQDLELIHAKCKHFELDKMIVTMPSNLSNQKYTHDRYLADLFLKHILLKANCIK